MQFLISYLYQVRNIKTYMIPLSTARSDPKWYHEGQDKSHAFIDKNGVLVGMRASVFAPDDNCSQYCPICIDRVHPCKFLEEYAKQLDRLDFDALMEQFHFTESRIRSIVDFQGHEPIFILLVHEAPNNPCSERGVIVNYFKKHGIDLKEFNKGEIL